MATDGTPEPAAKRCGEAIARLRTQRNWSRTQLLLRLYNELSPTDPCYLSLSETWLARLENGRMVKVPRTTVEALCRALRCTPQERARVLLYADRNVLAENDDEPPAVAEALTYVMDRLHREAGDVLAGPLALHPAALLDDLELLKLTASALDLLIARSTHHRERALHAEDESARAPQRVAQGAR